MQEQPQQDVCLVGREKRVGSVQPEGTFLQKLESRTGLTGGGVSRLTIDGQAYEIPSHLFERDRDGSYRLRMQLDEIERYRCNPETAYTTPQTSTAVPGSSVITGDSVRGHAPADLSEAPQNASTTEVETFPVIEEQATVETRTRETARVRVSKQVRHEEVTIDEPSYHTTVDVKRVPIGKYIDGPVADRTEGDTLIVPVLEEVVVVEKRLLLKEELHITRKREEYRDPQQLTLRKEDISIHRSELTGSLNQQLTKQED